MTRTPPHKQTEPCSLPGQIINPIQMCRCKLMPAAACPGEFEPGCDLGKNPKHVRVVERYLGQLRA